MILEPASDPPGQASFEAQLSLELQHDGDTTVIWARPDSADGARTPAALDGGALDEAAAPVSATAMLDRVVQRIFTAGLLLQVDPDDEFGVSSAEPAVDELRSALNDIRATVLSWSTGSEDASSHQLSDEFGATIAHLGAASLALKGLLAGIADGDDGIRFAAINDADRTVSCALIILLDAHADASVSEQSSG